MKITKHILLPRLLMLPLMLALFLGPPPAAAQMVEAADLSAADEADVRRIEAYMNKLDTLSARFLQISSNGAQAEGDLFISRPGRMRIQYDPPFPVFIVADGTWLIYVDKELDQVSHVPLDQTPAGILLDERIRILGDRFTITNFEKSANVLRLSVYKTNDPGEGALTLIFSDKPLALKKWTITDAQGILTSVSLLGSRYGLPLDGGLFKFDSPLTRAGDKG